MKVCFFYETTYFIEEKKKNVREYVSLMECWIGKVF